MIPTTCQKCYIWQRSVIEKTNKLRRTRFQLLLPFVFRQKFRLAQFKKKKKKYPEESKIIQTVLGQVNCKRKTRCWLPAFSPFKRLFQKCP